MISMVEIMLRLSASLVLHSSPPPPPPPQFGSQGIGQPGRRVSSAPVLRDDALSLPRVSG